MEGVQEVTPDLEEQTVTVIADESVEDQAMLEALLKWASASGKSVSLA